MGNAYGARVVSGNGVGLPSSGGVIREEHLNNEFDAIILAFNTSGHTHDGTTGEGGRIEVIGPAGEVTTEAAAIFSSTTQNVGLGKTGNVWKDLHVDNIKIDGNEISVIDTNGNLTLTPNGTGDVVIPTGSLNYDGTTVTTTGTELNLLDSDIAASSVTLAGTDGVIIDDDDGGVMAKALVSDIKTFVNTSPSITGTIAVTGGNAVIDAAEYWVLEVRGGTTNPGGVNTEGAIKLNCHVNSHGQTIKAQPHSESVTNTMLLPKGADSTLVSEVATQTLTNKRLDSPKINEDVVMTTTATKLNFVANVTSDIQAQLNSSTTMGKAIAMALVFGG